MGDLLFFDSFTEKFKALANNYKARFPTLEYDVEAELKK